MRPVYPITGPEPVFGLLHEPSGAARETAVLLVPPFGWEDMCSYRARRDWAERLAAAGHPALRFDLPGTGDSGGGPALPDRFGAWTQSVAQAAAWLREETGCPRVAAVGIGVGGLVAARAVGDGAPIDDLALWGVPAKGRAIARELGAFARLENAQLDGAAEAAPSPAPDGSLVVAGYLVTAETLAALGAVDLAVAGWADAATRRVLLLERDGRAVDKRLREALEAGGIAVAVAPGAGYAEMMMAEPQDSVPAIETFDQILGWLAGAPAVGGADAPRRRDDTPPSVELEVDGARLRETPVAFEHAFGPPFGILCEPADGGTAGLCAVLLNAGPQRRTGPNRMWVEAARRWAARGVPALRIDLASIGDGGGEERRFVDPRAFYELAYLDQVRAAFDLLEARGLPGRYVVGGLCVGAYWALQKALDDDRVVAALMVNPGALVYDGGKRRSVHEARVLVRKALRPETWRRVVSGRTTFSIHLATARGLLKGLPGMVRRRLHPRGRIAVAPDELEQAFDRLRDADRRALIVFAGIEPLYDDLVREGRIERLDCWPNLSVHHIPLPTEAHTIRPLWLQQRAHALMDEALERELARLSA